jgi:hypothetical protein
MLEKLNRGPVGLLTVLPNGPIAMGKSLVQWFVYSLIVSLFAAYVASMTLPRGAEYMQVFRVTSTVAILGYGVSQMEHSIWRGQSWGVTVKFVIDGVIYGLVTAGFFAWLWPDLA